MARGETFDWNLTHIECTYIRIQMNFVQSISFASEIMNMVYAKNKH